jgi:hypothetical protein
MNKEKWKRIAQEKGYLVSSWGRIFSLKSSKIMRPYFHKSRSSTYLRVNLGGKKYFVHTLVATNFKKKEFQNMLLENPQATLQVGHDDRNTLNNNLNNISWETESQNKTHMWSTGIITFGGKTYRAYMERSNHE